MPSTMPYVSRSEEVLLTHHGSKEPLLFRNLVPYAAKVVLLLLQRTLCVVFRYPQAVTFWRRVLMREPAFIAKAVYLRYL